MTRKPPVEDLRALMVKHSLTRTEVAKLAAVHIKTVESWLAADDAASHRDMPARHLMLIRAMLPDYLAARRRGD